MNRRAFAVAVLLVLLAFACRSTEERRREAEAAVLAHAIDTLRDAPNPGKAAALARVRGTPCEDRAVCALKVACVAAYEKHLSGLDASERAKSLLGVPDGGTSAALAAASELNRAQADLEEARPLTDACADAQGKLTRALKPK